MPAVATWTGAGTGTKWTTAANWIGDVAPQPGDDLVFPDGARQRANLNDFPAGTAFGSLSITGGGYSLAGNAITVANGVHADFAYTQDSSLLINVSGTGGVTKSGTGYFVLGGDNSYAGPTTIAGGRMEVRTATALGATGAGNDTTILAGGLNVSGTGLDIPEAMTVGDSLDVLSDSTVALSGQLTLAAAAGARVTFFVSISATLTITSGVAESGGPQTVLVNGFGNSTLAFAPTSVIAGEFSALGALVVFDGRAGAAGVSAGASSGGVVAGTGSVGAITASDSGRVSPGGDGVPGTLTAHDFTLEAAIPGSSYYQGRAAGELTMDLASAGSALTADRLDVLGGVSLGGVLTLRPATGFAPAPGGRVTLIDNQGTGPVQGTFAGRPEGSVVGQFGDVVLRITYRGGDGNDVELYAAPTSSLPQFAVGAGAGGGPQVNVYDATGALVRSFNAYDPAFTGGVRVATGDVTGDGVADVITAPGPGGGPDVRVFDGATGALVREWLAYDPAFRGGVNVAAAQIDTADKLADVITGAGAGGGPHVRVFSGKDGSVLAEWLAYDPAFRGGVSVAGFDVSLVQENAQDVPLPGSVVTGAGPGGGPHVREFSFPLDIHHVSASADFLAYDPAFRGGVNVATAAYSTSLQGPHYVFTAPASGGGPVVRVFSKSFLGYSQGGEFNAYDAAFRGGVTLATPRIGPSGLPALVTGAGPGGGPHVEQWDTFGLPPTRSFNAFDPAFTGGVFVG